MPEHSIVCVVPFFRLGVGGRVSNWGTYDANVRFIGQLVDAARAHGARVGIYSSHFDVRRHASYM